MRIFLTFIVIWMQIAPTLADESLITKKIDAEKDKTYTSYTCAPTVEFRKQQLPFSRVIWNTKQNAMYFSCCYKHVSGRDYCPPSGQVDLKGTVIPNTCKVGKDNLTGCVSSDTLSESRLDNQ
ncbi:MAG: hypothetical protein BGO67_12250 [Alphaproteobacteria bacterium 41-28]|nr:MAG: hypothetical protein BGO67_12250 [Alphaproteobacteria bacterium 41-28]